MLDRAAQFVDFVLLRRSFGLEFLGDASALVLGLFAANFELFGLPGEPLFELLRTPAAARELLGVVLRLGLSSLKRLLTLGKFRPGGFEFVLLACYHVSLLTELLEQQLMLTDLLGKRLIAVIEFSLRGLGVGGQSFGRGPQQFVALGSQIGFDLFEPRPLGRQKLLGARPMLGSPAARRRPAGRGIGLRLMFFHVRP
jgi:hypothetical protein